MADNVTNELIYKTLVSLREEMADVKHELSRNTDRINAFQEHLGAQQQDIGLLYKRDEETHHWKQTIESRLTALEARVGLEDTEH